MGSDELTLLVIFGFIFIITYKWHKHEQKGAVEMLKLWREKCFLKSGLLHIEQGQRQFSTFYEHMSADFLFRPLPLQQVIHTGAQRPTCLFPSNITRVHVFICLTRPFSCPCLSSPQAAALILWTSTLATPTFRIDHAEVLGHPGSSWAAFQVAMQGEDARFSFSDLGGPTK